MVQQQQHQNTSQVYQGVNTTDPGYQGGNPGTYNDGRGGNQMF